MQDRDFVLCPDNQHRKCPRRPADAARRSRSDPHDRTLPPTTPSGAADERHDSGPPSSPADERIAGPASPPHTAAPGSAPGAVPSAAEDASSAYYDELAAAR